MCVCVLCSFSSALSLKKCLWFLFVSVKPLTAGHVCRERRHRGRRSQPAIESGYSSAERSFVGGDGAFLSLIHIILMFLLMV